jgi:predicted ATP-grasp superfamily ATP-dependent carboligase
MKLAVEYMIERTDYRLIIDVEESNILEEVNKMLKEICEKFDGKVERYRVSKIVEELDIDTDPTTTDTTLHSSDNSNFIIKTVFSHIPYVRSVTDSISNSFSKEEKIIDVSYPCSTRS